MLPIWNFAASCYLSRKVNLDSTDFIFYFLNFRCVIVRLLASYISFFILVYLGELECFVGYFISLDKFLYEWTYLPGSSL